MSAKFMRANAPVAEIIVHKANEPSSKWALIPDRATFLGHCNARKDKNTFLAFLRRSEKARGMYANVKNKFAAPEALGWLSKVTLSSIG